LANFVGFPLYIFQCCGSGSGIRCLFDPWIRDPGSRRVADSSDPGWKKVGSGIRDKHPGSATLIFFIFISSPVTHVDGCLSGQALQDVEEKLVVVFLVSQVPEIFNILIKVVLQICGVFIRIRILLFFQFSGFKMPTRMSFYTKFDTSCRYLPISHQSSIPDP
jgi:hypothetical protein